MSLLLRTPFGSPVPWARVVVASDAGDSHAHNDDRCLVVTGRCLGEPTDDPFDDFMLCLLADGATGSTFANAAGQAPRPAGWRSSQLAQAAFVDAFLASDDVDILQRLRDAIKAADGRLARSKEGLLSSTLTALFLARDGTAYGVSVGDSALLVFPPRRDQRKADRRVKKLGYEDTTAVGNGETLLASSEGGGERIIEQWWPAMDGDGTRTRLEPGTHLVLLSDGVAESLPADLVGRLAARKPFEQVAHAIVQQTRALRVEARWREGGSISETGLDNMSVIAVRFDGGTGMTSGPGQAERVSTPGLVAHAGWLICTVGQHGGPSTDAGGPFGLACLAEDGASQVVPGFLRSVLENGPGESAACSREALSRCFDIAGGDMEKTRLAVVATGPDGTTATFAAGGASAEPVNA